MKNFRDYLAESEYADLNPVVGDNFDLELGTDFCLETHVVELRGDDIVIEATQAAIDELSSLMEGYGCEYDDSNVEQSNDKEMDEAKYQGREVSLGKPMAGDVKKSKVYVRGPKGNVVKVNFGDKKMKIKKSNPKRRKSFRARHNCKNPGPRWKARYWSCRAW
jgi:hypothetical protein